MSFGFNQEKGLWNGQQNALWNRRKSSRSSEHSAFYLVAKSSERQVITPELSENLDKAGAHVFLCG